MQFNMDKWVQLNNHVAGRDKIARFVQYASRAVWDTLEKKDLSPALTDNFKTLEYILSTFRKLLRFGKCLDVFYASLRTIHYPDLAIRVTLTLGKLSQALFLLADHFMWLARTGLFKSINTKKWSKFANKYWLLSIIMNLCRDVYEIYRLLDLHKASVKSGISRCNAVPMRLNSPRELSRIALHSYAMILGHKDVFVDTVKNVCDFFIPLTALGYTNMSPRTIGLLGAISSLAGLYALIEPKAKLTPA
ncbi:peroxisomal membrane protein 11B [Teleopsis dalmanni]|uniref:peroxisomal membrane protein 11B n=1 Tax=Teleopsis dalmanni TaxID=139649 RepID=UPI0018CF77C2|nr:peroxisomal membrane protein 11B [Teleopsis dalmanni]